MVTVNGFSVEVVSTGGPFNSPNSNYIVLPNKTEYSLRLCNHHNTNCDVYVKIDGQKIGGWKIQANSCITIERPGDDAHRFTFFSETSPEAIGANINVGGPNNGLVEVTFYPRRPYYRYNEPSPRLLQSAPPMRASSSYESGVTLMGRESYQQFGQTKSLDPDEIDWANVTTIYLRLVAQSQPTYYRYQPRSNRFPPRIDEPIPPYFPSPNPPYFPQSFER